MYVYACVCKCIVEEREHANKHNSGYLLGEGEGIRIGRGHYTHTHTHTHIYIHKYVHMYTYNKLGMHLFM